MGKLKRLLVIMVTENGDAISISVKTRGNNFTAADKERLKRDVEKKLLSREEDALYFRIRYSEKEGKLRGTTESIKVLSSKSLLSEIDNIFARLGVNND